MNLINFSKCKLSNKAYGGSEKKIGVFFNNKYYMLKFQKKSPFGVRFNTISEYLGSHIYQMLGINAQDTILGTYDGNNVVACKDFILDGYQFVPFNDVGESTIEEDKEAYQYSYDDIVELLEDNKKLTNVKETVSVFFDMYIVDALLGNFDRHGGNWGFLKKDNRYQLAPIFDNGSCLYPSVNDEEIMEKIINDEEEINRRIYKFPTSQIRLNNEKSSYYEVISSLSFDGINNALAKIYPKINIKKIYELIDDISIISDTHKKFYKTMINHRYEKILKCSYKKLKKEKYENI